MDDFLVFADDKRLLWDWLDQARAQLAKYRLLAHEAKTRIYPVEESIPFLGFRVFPGYRRLLPDSVRRARLRLKRLEHAHAQGWIGIQQVKQSVTAWIAHSEHGDTYGLRRHLLSGVAFRAGGRSSAAGRLLEQQQEQRSLRQPQQQQPAQP